MGRNSRSAPLSLGRKLRAVRLHLGMTQAQLLAVVKPGEDAENRGLISQYELGKSAPDYQTLLRYARLAKVSTDALIDDKMKLSLGKIHKPIESTATDDAEVVGDKHTAGQSAGAAPDAGDADSNPADSHNKGGNYRVSNSSIGEEAASINSPAEKQRSAVENSPTAETGNQEVSFPAAATTDGSADTNVAADTVATDTVVADTAANATAGDTAMPPRRMESFAVRVDSRLLDLIDDDYLDLMHLVPRSLRPKVNREDFFRVLIVSSIADYHDHGEDSCLVSHWRQLTQRIARRAAPITPVMSEK